jgi:inhibitor of KinA
MRLVPLSDTALLIQLGEAIDADVLARIATFSAALEKAALPGIVELVPAYASLAVHYEPEAVPRQRGESPAAALERAVSAALAGARRARRARGRVVDLPVRYGGEDGPDLPELAAHAELTEKQVIRMHSGAEYTVAMIGFAPGFPYLIGMPERLAMPRRDTPRIAVPAGSVGIAGRQTGIYTLETPGGWHIIGRTAVRLFDPAGAPPSLLHAGDRVRFVPVTG